MKDIVLYCLGSSGLIFALVQWWMKNRDKKAEKSEKTESEVILMLRSENLELQKKVLNIEKRVQELSAELHLAELKVQRYEQGMNIILGVIQNLKSLHTDEKVVIDAIVKNLQTA